MVQFNSTLGQLGLFIERVPAKVKGAVTEVTDEFTGFGTVGGVLHDEEFQETNKGQDLEGSGNRDRERGIPAVSEVGELGARVVNVTREVDTGGVDQVSDNTQHTDAAVLDLDVTEAVELFLVTIGNKAKGIEEAKRSLGAQFVLEGLQGRGGGLLGGRGESGGGGDEGGENSRLLT